LATLLIITAASESFNLAPSSYSKNLSLLFPLLNLTYILNALLGFTEGNQNQHK